MPSQSPLCSSPKPQKHRQNNKPCTQKQTKPPGGRCEFAEGVLSVSAAMKPRIDEFVCVFDFFVNHKKDNLWEAAAYACPFFSVDAPNVCLSDLCLDFVELSSNMLFEKYSYCNYELKLMISECFDAFETISVCVCGEMSL
ncbi:MAG: hypothetical protein NWF05_06930 [Candidatus Bathyarchaeota archaeon]|nr:hypothetical protein [Candidatus Bathyarchaeota archaeon]